MDRRAFFKSLGALALIPALPVLAKPVGAGLSLAALQCAHNQLLDPYYTIIHPSQWKDLCEYVARDAWADRWRKYRLALRSGSPEMTPRQIMADWEPPAPFNKAEFGVFESVRFIESARVA
jgi:hypothetical protein